MIEKFVYDFVFDKLRKIFVDANKENFFHENVGGIARKAKRFITYIMSEGLVRALMFAYSKAKTKNIYDFRRVIESEVHGNMKWSETHDWLVVSKFTIDFIKERFGGILGNLSTDPEAFISTLIANRDKLIYIEKLTIKALNTLSMLCFALEKK